MLASLPDASTNLPYTLRRRSSQPASSLHDAQPSTGSPLLRNRWAPPAPPSRFGKWKESLPISSWGLRGLSAGA